MAYTITTGTGSSVGVANPTPAYPNSGMGSGKLALMQCFVRGDASGTLTPPVGWTQQGSTVSVVTDNFQSIFSRVLDGTETPGGTVTVTSTGSTGRRAAWINVVDTTGGSGWNFENITSVTAGAGQTTINDKAVTTGGSGRLAVNFIGYPNRQTGGQENFVNETGGSWVASAYFESGNTPTLSLQTAELASAGTIDNGTDTSITASPYIIHGFSLWRNISSVCDLTVTDITWTPASPRIGDNVTLSAVIENIGSAPSPQGVVHGVRFVVFGSAQQFATQWTTSLAAVSGSATVVADGVWIPTISGSSNIIATVDYNNTIAESGPAANNARTETLIVADSPNIRITDIYWTPAAPVVGDAVQLNVAVFNAGLAATPTTVHGVDFSIGGSPVALSTTYTASIAVSASANISADAPWVPNSSGSFQVVATFDPTDIIAETNETDNILSEIVTVAVGSANAVLTFNGRGPSVAGNITPLQSDYDQFFLTQSEGGDIYVELANVTADLAAFATLNYVNSTFITPASADSLFISQTEANAQGMPAIEAVAFNGPGTPSGPVTYGTGDITLRTAATPADFWQSRLNTDNVTRNVSPPSGYTISGLATINAGQSALFVKQSGASTFRRWS